MDDNWNREMISSFIRVGIIVLTAIGVFALGINYMPDAVSVTSNSTRKLPICSVETDKPQVAISFDTTYSNDQIQQILECLKKNKVKATFFLTGGFVDRHKEEVKGIADAGHDIGNHSQNHKNMSLLSEEDCRNEIQMVHDKVKALTGKDMNLFRAPYDAYNDTLINVCNDMKYYCIQWDVDSYDWKDYDARSITNRILKGKQLKNGSILLFHSDGKYTLEALPVILAGLKKKGYEIVPVSQLIYKENYELNYEGRQFKK